MTHQWSTDEPLTALLIDDSEEQFRKIRDAVRPHGIGVEWVSSYRAAVDVLQDPDVSHLVDVVLIDQTFDEDTVDRDDLLTRADVEPRPEMDEWDDQLHQGLFILARLDQDVHDGVIPFVPMMILTHHGRLALAARVGDMQLGGYASKQDLLSDPYKILRGSVPGIQPTNVVIDRKLGELAADVKIEGHLLRQIRDSIRAGLDPDIACSALRRLPDPNDWRVVGLTLEEIDPARSSFSSDELARTLAQAWYRSPDGWLRVHELTPLGPLDERFHAFRMEMGRPRGKPFSALVAATAVAAADAPGSGVLRERFRLLRHIDGCSHPVRIRTGSWMVLGCWLREPSLVGGGEPARGPHGAGRRVRDLHRMGLAHGSLTLLTTAFEPPVFGGIRCLLGADIGDLQADDLARLAAPATRIAAAPPPRPHAGGSRALHWRTTPLDDGTRMRTRRSQWSPEPWRELTSGLAAARDALADLPVERCPFGLVDLRAYDATGERCAIDDPAAELLEYDVRVPGAAVPLTGRVPDASSHAVRRRLAADVLRQLIRWDRSGLVYRTMEPDGLVCAGGAVHCDLLQSIVRGDPHARRRQRRGAAASLVFLLSPWPYLWPTVVERTLPMLDHGPEERSAWGIAAAAVRALLDQDQSQASLAVLEERIDLLEAAARLDGRFPAWPPGLAAAPYP